MIVRLWILLIACGSKSPPPSTPEPALPADAALADAVALDAPPPDATTTTTPTREEITALSKFGFVTIESSARTKIYLDDMLIGETPIARLPVKPGPHTIRAVGPKQQTRSIAITVYGGQDTTVPTIVW